MLEAIKNHPALIMWYAALFMFLMTLFTILGARNQAIRDEGDFRNRFVIRLWRGGVFFPVLMTIGLLVVAVLMELGKLQ